MSEKPITYFAWLITCATLIYPFATHAQDDRWYQVELVVFSQSAGSGAEQWDAIPDLEYPRNSRFLTDKAPTTQTDTASALPLASSQPTPFVTLPSSQQEFRGRVASMQRTGRYRVLFHEAWNQPIVGQSSAIPIILDHSGDGGAWPALQGSIKIYLARYLYVETNLWLNTQGEYLKGSWQMPPPPLAPSSVVMGGAMEDTMGGEDNMEEVFLTELDRRAPSQPSQPQSETQEQTPPQTASVDEYGIATEIKDPEVVYPYRHAVQLKQTRRMRSSEIHYIDHPLLGIIVKITPLAAAEPQDSTPAA